MVSRGGTRILSDVRVLVVDDSAPVRKRLRALLDEVQGVEVSEAGDPWEALRFLDSKCVDAVLLDMHMGDYDGLTLIREVKRRVPNAVVAVLTNDASEAHRSECLRRGADFFFDKSREFETAAQVVVGFRPNAG